jgi:hypothetical protein
MMDRKRESEMGIPTEKKQAAEPRSWTERLASPVVDFWAGDWLHMPRWIAAGGGVLLIAVLTAAIGPIHVRNYGHDVFFLLDNGWRALHGQRVHVDYSSGWGPLTFLLVAAGLAVSGGSVAAISYANAFAALVAGLWSAWLAAARSRTLTAVAYPCFVALLAGAPFALGDGFVWTSHGMVYNRYGYALLAIVMLECYQPASEDSPSRRRLWGEPVLTGCAVALLLFLKITYFLVVLPIVGISLLLWERRGPRALAYAAGFAGTALVFLAYLRFDAAAMVNDLLAAGAARSATLGLRHTLEGLLAGAFNHGAPLVLLALGCAWWFRIPETGAVPFWRACRYPLAAVVVAVADVLLLATNAQAYSFPLMAILAMLLLFSIDPALRPSAPARSRKRATVLLLLAGWLAGPTMLLQGLGLACALAEARANPNPPGVLRFESPRLRPLVLYDSDIVAVDKYSNGREYVGSLNDGIRLLLAHTGPNDKVANLDMFNPFAYALGREPIRGGIAAAAYRYTLDERHHPSPARFFADAAVVMVPKRPATPPEYYDGYRKIYQPALEREFRLEAESSRWWLYRRVAPRDASSAPANR